MKPELFCKCLFFGSSCVQRLFLFSSQFDISETLKYRMTDDWHGCKLSVSLHSIQRTAATIHSNITCPQTRSGRHFGVLPLGVLKQGLTPFPCFGNGKRGHYERGLFTGGSSGISKVSRFSRISRKWSDSPLLSTVWGFSKNSRISKFPRISRKWTFVKRPLF